MGIWLQRLPHRCYTLFNYRAEPDYGRLAEHRGEFALVSRWRHLSSCEACDDCAYTFRHMGNLYTHHIGNGRAGRNRCRCKGVRPLRQPLAISLWRTEGRLHSPHVTLRCQWCAYCRNHASTYPEGQHCQRQFRLEESASLVA